MRTIFRIFIVTLLGLGILIGPTPLVLAANLDTTADGVIGQADFTHRLVNSGGLNANSLSSPSSVTIDRLGNLYVADSANHRVLEYNAPLSTHMAANRVFGQDGSFTTNTANLGGVSAKSLSNPTGVAVDAQGNLYVADTDNNRVLVYDNPLASTGDTTADHVLGQSDSFTTNTPNNGGISAVSMSGPTGLAVDAQGNLYVADQANHRVLVFYAPTADHPFANWIFGQGNNATTNTANKGGLSSNSLNSPAAVAVDAQSNLFIADRDNHRVLEYDTPLTSNTTADHVFGQGGSFTSAVANNGGVSADSLNAPNGLALNAGGDLYVADQANHRVLAYTTPLALTGETTADVVFGQGGSMTSNTFNNGGLSANSLYSPRGLAVDAVGNLYTTDHDNQRVLTYDLPLPNSLPGLSALSPSTVAAAGPAFTLTVTGSGFVPGSLVRWNGSSRPTTFLTSTQLNAAIPAADVASGGPFALTVFNPAPGGGTSPAVNLVLYDRGNLNGVADGVLGQPNFTTTPSNNPLLPGRANRLNYPYRLNVDPHSGRLFVVDYSNNRVLSWADAAAFANSQAADLVIGQPDMTSNALNNGGIGANTLYSPGAAVVDSLGNLYVADMNNNRVLIYPYPLSTGMAAGWVIGQPDFVTGTVNTGGISANSLYHPSGLAVDNQGNLYVVDQNNSRILEYNTPLTTDLIADRVFGQGGSFITNDPNKAGLSADSIYSPESAALDAQGNLYVADFGNNRVLEYNTPLTSGTTADRVFGQGGSFITNDSNKAGLSADSLYGPCGVVLDAQGNLYVTDYWNSRVLEYNMPLTSGATADNVFGQGGVFNTGTANKGGVSATSLNHPTGVALDSRGNLFVADAWNNRVLEYDLPLPYGVPVVTTLGPSTLAAAGPAFTLTVNGSGFVAGSVVQWNGSDRPTTYLNSTQLTAAIPAADVTADIAEGGPFAVRVTNPTPGGGDSPTYLNLDLYLRQNQDVIADGVLGQPNFATNTDNNVLLPAAARLAHATRAAVDLHSGRLFVADYGNNRVLSWPDAAAFANSQAADLIIGQPNFFSILANNGGRSARTLASPFGLAVDGQGNLYVADYANNRVLLYIAPLSSGMAASKVFGQGGSFTTGSVNNGGISANSLAEPTGLALDAQGNLYVADYANNRVLEYDAPLTGDTTAEHVFGQAGSFTTNASNNGGLGANSLAGPAGVALDAQGNLYVADFFNQRVLEYDMPLTSGVTADRVFGQSDVMTTNAGNKGGLSATSLALPVDVAVDAQGNLYVADRSNNRVLEYDSPLSSENDTTADRVFGQNGAFNTAAANNGGLSTASLSWPFGVTLDAKGDLLVTDYANSRLLEFDVPVLYITPVLSSLLPDTAPAGSPALPVTVSGSGFVSVSVVRWNGADLTTTYVDSGHLTITIPTASLASAGTAAVTVFTPAPGGGLSSALNFTITNPLPQFTLLSPTSIVIGSPATTLNLTGSNFVSTSVVRWNGTDLATVFVDGSHLNATVSASSLSVVGTATLTVFNPAPGGGSSAGLSIAIIQRRLFLPSVTR